MQASAVRPDALNPYRNSFHAIRLLAALQVVYMHSYGHLGLSAGPIFRLASQFPGVPIFFAASGFLVLDSFLRSRSALAYLKSRAARIYPGLALNVAVIETAFWLGGGMTFAGMSLAGVLGYELAYIATASELLGFRISGSGPRWNVPDLGFWERYPSGVLWTLTVELSFYVAMLFLGPFMHFRRAGTVVLAVSAAASLFLLFYFAGNKKPPVLFITAAPYFWLFAIGMLARLWIVEIAAIRILPIAVGVILALVFFASGFSGIDYKVNPDFVGVAKAALVCLFAIALGMSPWLRSSALVRHDFSYGIYLYHMLFVATAQALGWSGTWVFVGVILLTIGTAALSWHAIERPVIDLAKRGFRWPVPAAG
ncbi:acyltransferase family protein [Mesorhizobium sp. ZC-5]|uniref:acyltransferase family protein n=1 Tax=Mesorhizobium sp. ZC-5 TaxID=2986066 RepID=UPI0021E6F096|nr:acyltransferase [Mesorhizobium sp. ZC-5]MCV3238967.1 acyltransferase [Mesorhizobium sp. ZC-5]